MLGRAVEGFGNNLYARLCRARLGAVVGGSVACGFFTGGLTGYVGSSRCSSNFFASAYNEEIRLGQLAGCPQESRVDRQRRGLGGNEVMTTYTINNCETPEQTLSIKNTAFASAQPAYDTCWSDFFPFIPAIAMAGGMVIGGIVGLVTPPSPRAYRVAAPAADFVISVHGVAAKDDKKGLEIKTPTFKERLAKISYSGEIPDEFKDPASLEIMDHPVSLIPKSIRHGETDSHTVDLSTFNDMRKQAKQDNVDLKDPITRQEVEHYCVINSTLKKAIERWVSLQESEYRNRLGLQASSSSVAAAAPVALSLKGSEHLSSQGMFTEGSAPSRLSAAASAMSPENNNAEQIEGSSPCAAAASIATPASGPRAKAD